MGSHSKKYTRKRNDALTPKLVKDSLPLLSKEEEKELTAKLRNGVKSILEGNMDKLESQLDELTGKDYIAAWAALIPFALPRLSASQQIVQEASEQKIIVRLEDGGDW